jgi:DNA-binding beta-propeller fold protein YncE
MALALALLVPAGPVLAADHAFVVNHKSRELTVIDLWKKQVVGNWRTDRKPRGAATSPDGSYVYVAANNDLTILDVLDPSNRIDVELNTGLESTDVTVSNDGRYVLISKRQATQVTVVDLDDPQIDDCIAHHTRDCTPSSGIGTRNMPFAGGEFIEAHPNGSFYVVNIDGRIARASSATSNFGEVMTAPSQRPTYPGGMTIDVNGDVLITTNTNCDNAHACIKRLTISGTLSQMPFRFSEVGGIAVDPNPNPPHLNDIVVTLPGQNAVAHIRGNSYFTVPLPGAKNPVAIAISKAGTGVTANLGPDVTQENASIVWPFGAFATPLELGADPTEINAPVAVAVGPHVAWNSNPRSLSWTYSKLGVSNGEKTIVFGSWGDEAVWFGELELIGRDRANFRITQDDCSGQGLDPGQSCRVKIDFKAGSFDKLIRTYHWGYGASLSVPSTSLSTDMIRLSGVHPTSILKKKLRDGTLRLEAVGRTP